MIAAHRRHAISDHIWEILAPHRRRDLPPDYGDWKNTHRRFCRWRDKGVWENLLKLLVNEPDFEWLMIDASFIKVHHDGTGAVGGNQDMAVTKGGSTPRYI